MPPGTLFIVSTPIGNLEDISLRGIRTLKEAGFIAAEDTRRVKTLLNKFGIRTRCISFHAHSGKAKTEEIMNKMLEGHDIALVSDSGTPGISDPGYVLITRCIDRGINITAVPGATALVAALVLSGMPTNKFIFEGFLSNKGARRKNQIAALLAEERTVIVYESPHRLEKFLRDFEELAGDRQIAVAREITKKFEEVRRGTAAEHLEHFRNNRPRGEFILVF